MKLGIDKAPEPFTRDELTDLVAPILERLDVKPEDLRTLHVTGKVVTARLAARTSRGKLLPDSEVRLTVRVIDE